MSTEVTEVQFQAAHPNSGDAFLARFSIVLNGDFKVHGDVVRSSTNERGYFFKDPQRTWTNRAGELQSFTQAHPITAECRALISDTLETEYQAWLSKVTARAKVYKDSTAQADAVSEEKSDSSTEPEAGEKSE